MTRLLILLFCMLFTLHLSAQSGLSPMTNTLMDSLLRQQVRMVEGGPGSWQLVYRDRPVVIITDEAANRMRIFSPIVPEDKVPTDELRKMLLANFHSALDAKYALYEGYVISVFTHPLGELQPEQFQDALLQVVTLAETFGTTYSSTDLIFPGASGSEEKEEQKRLNKKPNRS